MTQTGRNFCPGLRHHRIGFGCTGFSGFRRCVRVSNLALPKTGCTSAESKQGGLRRSPSVSAMPKRGNGLAWCSTYSGLWLCSRFALFFEARTQSRTAVQGERRIKRSLNYAEAKPALAAKQQQYAPSFSLSAPCILLTLTHRLRFISNPYFDTPSFSLPPRISSPTLLLPFPRLFRLFA